MGLFGRSNKKKIPPSQSPNYDDSNELRRQPHPIPTTRPNWFYIEQRPHQTSNVYNYHRPAPQGWIVAQIEPPSPPPRYQPHTLMAPPLLPPRNGVALMNLRSVTNLLTETSFNDLPCVAAINNGVAVMSQQTVHHYHQTTALYDTLSSKLCAVVTSIDEERFSGDDRELTVPQHYDSVWQEEKELETTSRDLFLRSKKSKANLKTIKSSETTHTNYFSKVHAYANSRLPMDLKPMRLYFNTYPLLCLAAQYSEQVYSKPTGQEKETRVNARGRAGTVMKSVPIDDRDVIVFAIRGTTHSFTDWAVNVKTKPTSPEGFLDDPGNLCHSGFLGAAKDFIQPIAARLRNLLQENPNRTQCSLLITGHSAGGAIAALLYSHMLSTSPEARSELNVLTGYFKRIHCITFGAPPISLLPLEKPKTRAASKSIFMSFVNEGDLVARADFAYVRSLLDLYSSPTPGKSVLEPLKLGLKPCKSSNALLTKKKHSKPDPHVALGPIWPVPEATLSNAGSIVLLRGVDRLGNAEGSKKLQDRMDDGVIAQIVSDEVLRGVVWGDPVSHMMKLYARRIEVLATNAVMGRT
ncbi:uncharacterized protein EAF01_008755 [Botrytis porri]|uniref:Fungal lipase-type domain-containing protein n=1 Tax=Botrytis porri TaxID=87229 RepID=A0A4Z1KRP3_9HELO|nr:uncharacterized protein EAF01_008755 [Botrytis porri]KAF7897789.1 hypothetical protein EAF01_008755 [Botrytis porri]TGO87134.1 hypothetical protein BPOR_0248g00080 [Botrytis porri]